LLTRWDDKATRPKKPRTPAKASIKPAKRRARA
jgi:hypothetical protein